MMFYEELQLYQVIITRRLAKDPNISQQRRFLPHVKVLYHSFFLHINKGCGKCNIDIFFVQDVNKQQMASYNFAM